MNSCSRMQLRNLKCPHVIDVFSVVPPRGRKGVLQELHKGHPGMTKMKGLARMYVW